MTNNYDYDAVIIGAGISGLVCGCYLAKAGMKVLIVEKNANPGGYCTSFTRKGFTFDACAHSLGSVRENGNVARILNELEVGDRINIVRCDPSDIIIAPDHKVVFWNDLNRTITDLQANFPAESASIESFFNYIDKYSGAVLVAELRNKTFKELLDLYFRDEKLKAVLALPVLGNVGLPASLASALTAVTIYKEFIYDGGNYPEGGMQELPDLLKIRFEEYGGEILLTKTVKKITMNDGQVSGVQLKNNTRFSAKYVISNADTRHTFLDMIDGTEDEVLADNLNNLTPALSMFILYLGVGPDYKGFPTTFSNIWNMPDYDVEGMYRKAVRGDIENSDWFLLRASKEQKTLLMLVNAAFRTKDFWKENKGRLTDLFIQKVEQVLPGFSDHIVFKDAATPHTLYRYTFNYKGSAYGWAGMPSQFGVRGLSQTTSIKNLYLTGHWTTTAQGISGVSYLGRSTARMILTKEKYN